MFFRIKKIFDKLLLGHELSKSIPWEIYLNNNNDINACASQDGILIINKGLIDYCKNDDELALVIGHEMAHIVKKHIHKQLGASVIAQFIIQKTADYIMKKIKELDDNIVIQKTKQILFELIFGFAGEVGLLKFSRIQEYEADKLGAWYAANAGYDISAGCNFWIRMSNDFGEEQVGFLSTHPQSKKRAQKILEITKNSNGGKYEK